MRGLARGLFLLIGILFVVLGVWWACRGTGLVPIGFMAHHMQWAYRGAALAAFGVVLAVVSRRI